MGKCVKTLVVKRRATRQTTYNANEDYSAILDEIEQATAIVSEQPSTVALRQARRARNPLDRTRTRCLRELKALFGAYLSGDYDRDNESAVSLGQINIIGELLESENPEGVFAELFH